MAINKCIPKDIAKELKKQFKSEPNISPASLKEKVTSLVKKKYGIALDSKVSNDVISKSKELNNAKKKLGKNMEFLGDPKKQKETIDFIKAQNELNNTLKGLAPSSKTDVTLGIIGRSFMLSNPSSMIMNIEGNIMTGLGQAIVRRIKNFNLGKHSKFSKEYIKNVREIYKQTGIDISRVKNSDDFYNSAELLLGKDLVSSEGVTGAAGYLARQSEKYIFRGANGVPDSVFGSLSFIDSLVLDSAKYADIDELIVKARNSKNITEQKVLEEARRKFGNGENFLDKLKRDAANIEPTTQLGRQLREESVQEAKVSTLTQSTKTSDVINGIKTAINKGTNSKIGDVMMPFVKTPANFISMGLDYAGKGYGKALRDVIKGRTKTPAEIKTIISNIAKSTIGIGAAYGVSTMFDETDFVSAYDPQRQQIEQLKNSTYDAVRIGDNWYSLDLFGPLSIPLTGMLYAKKGDGYVDKMYQYFQGVKNQTLKLPGVDLAKSVADTASTGRKQELDTNAIVKNVAGEIGSRAIPSAIATTATVLDPYQRDTSSTFGKPLSRVPIFRQNLPVKETIFGEKMKADNVLKTILGGSRLKTDTSTSVTKEIDKVANDNNKYIQFSDLKNSTSMEVTQFRNKLGEKKFNEATDFYGETLKKELETLFKNPRYNMMSSKEKLEQIQLQDEQAKDKTFKKYNFKYQKAKSTKKSNIKL